MYLTLPIYILFRIKSRYYMDLCAIISTYPVLGSKTGNQSASAGYLEYILQNERKCLIWLLTGYALVQVICRQLW